MSWHRKATPDPALAPQLLAHVDGKRLNKNAARYEELSAEIDADRLEAARNHLLGLPLVYSAHCSFEELMQHGILPHEQRPHGAKTHSTPLDESLGLTRYAFMHWGVGNREQYGKHELLINPELLLDARTVVTPFDILKYASRGAPYDFLPSADKKNIREHYFNYMVRGRDWLDIVAHRLVLHTLKDEAAAYPLEHPETLGEVKFHGVVNPNWFIGAIACHEEAAYLDEVREYGFEVPSG